MEVSTDPLEPVGQRVEEEGCGEYYFESDSLGLRSNKDYQDLLRTYSILLGQRTQALLNRDKLLEIQEKALADPIVFVEKLQRGEDVGIPRAQCIAKIPEIDWEKYKIDTGMFSGKNKHRTRQGQNGSATVIKSETSSDSLSRHAKPVVVGNKVLVRGRVYTETKPATFNQPWTPEEQLQLEQLLVKFPPELVESKRWSKIAKELGNRTQQQVASRVQKYFIKLAKARLPVPGRIPRFNAAPQRKNRMHCHQRYNRYLYQPSTFFAAYEPHTILSEYDDDNSSSCNQSAANSGDESSDEDILPEMKSDPDYKELKLIKSVLKDRIKVSSGLVIHKGFKCSSCECSPIVGTRWRCVSCADEETVDLCQGCKNSSFQSDSHDPSHEFIPITEVETLSHLDSDYRVFGTNGLSYLDPNYMPAT